MKCNICKSGIDTIFLEKMIGTIIKDKAGKKHEICFECQKKFNNNKEEMLKNI